MKKVNISMFHVSYTGRRENNEDQVFTAVDTSSPGGRAVVTVADGMGGYRKSGTASKMVVDRLKKMSREEFPGDPVQARALLEGHIKQVNRHINGAGRGVEGRTMGTTVTGAVIKEDKCLFFNVGDSRTYLVSGGRIRRMTRDHSHDMEKFEQGEISEEEIGRGLYSHALTRAVGTEPEVEVDIFPENSRHCVLREGDVILSCSDGLWNVVPEVEIYREIVGRDSLESSLEALAYRAYINDSPDNISIAALEYGQLPRINLNLGRYTPLKKNERGPLRRKKILLMFLLLFSIIAFLVVTGLLAFNLIRNGTISPVRKPAQQSQVVPGGPERNARASPARAKRKSPG